MNACGICGAKYSYEGKYCSCKCRKMADKISTAQANVMKNYKKKVANEMKGIKIGHPEKRAVEAKKRGLTYGQLQALKTLDMVGKIEV